MTRAAVLAVTLTACVPSAFEDHRPQAWSDSSRQPDGVTSADYPLAITTVDTERPGATIVVAGGSPVSFTTLSYDDSGVLEQRGMEVAELDFAGVPAVAGALEPIAGGDGVFAVGGVADSETILLYDSRTGAQGPLRRLSIEGDQCGENMVDLGDALVLGQTNAGGDVEPDLLVVSGTKLLVFPDIGLEDQPACYQCVLTDGAGRAGRGMAVALADIDESEGDEIVVTIEDAEGGPATVMMMDAAKIVEANGSDCSAASPQVSNLTSPSAEADFGALIAVGDADDNEEPELALVAPSSQRVHVLTNVSQDGPDSIQTVLPPAGSGAFGAAVAFGDIDGDDLEELAIGDPRASPATVEAAGQVTIFSYYEADGFEVDGILHDSTPEPDQEFGRALVIAEFVAVDDDQDVLVVGARREVFTYFRALAAAEDPRE